MTFDVFVSYSSKDKAVADAACAMIEGAGIRCWIAPRDVPPGSQWAATIVDAIDHCRLMVLIFSSQANISSQIEREVERAVSKGVPIIPMRIENVLPTSSSEYFLGSIHWLDALTPPLEQHLRRLAETVKSCLDVDSAPGISSSPKRPHRLSNGLRSGVAAGAAVQRTWRMPLLLGALLIAVCAGAYVLRPAPDTKPNPAPAASGELSKQELPIPFSGFDDALVHELAANQSIPLPQTVAVNSPGSGVRARFADYLGAWGGDQRWGGTGRNALLIVEDIDETGRATGIFAAGPPTATTASKAPANFTTFSGQVTDVGIAFAWGTLHYMFKRLPENLMQGHLEGEIAQRQIVNTIILQRIMPGMKLPTGGPGDVSAAAPPSPPANPQPIAATEPAPAPLETFNEAAVRKLADQQKIPLPPVLGVIAPSANVPAVFSDFVGAWGGQQRWNQTGRNAILIIESVDEKGNVSGILAQGPPTPTSAGQNPASFTAFAAEETDGVINFTWGTFTYSFRRLPGKLLWGHLEGLVAQRRVNATITLQQIECSRRTGSGAHSQPTWQCCDQPSLSFSSTSRLPSHSA